MAAVLDETPVISERPKLVVRDLNFFYGRFHALRHVNLEIPEKRVTAFIGPSGCGKSTLLRCFNRMYELYPEQRAEGEILMGGENILRWKGDVSPNSTSSPRYMKAVNCEMRAACSMLWVTMTIVNSDRSCSISSSILPVEIGSSAEVGSSKRTTSGR